ncbi:MAG TPA: hypothetical protein VGA85_07270 [Dehalococcoidales bacterium]
MEKITKQLQTFCNGVKDKFRENIERERSLDRPLEAISRVLWPYPESKLIFYVSLLAVLDYLSTFIALELSGKGQLSEVGLLANWALETGGFPRLLFVDAAVIFSLICVAINAKSIYTRLGLRGFARAAFAFLLVPYFVFIMGAVVNNVLVAFL